jgi:YjbE family integral membrane protein
MLEAYQSEIIALLQIIVIDVVLAGDNAIVVGMAASRVAPEMRAKVVLWGIVGAVLLRVVFAAVTVQLLAIVGLTLAGGILLMWVCWKMYRELRHDPHATSTGAAVSHGGDVDAGKTMGFWSAILQIIVADVSMSLDNVLAVAGAARGHTMILIIGLAIAVVLMAVAASFIAKLLARYPWVTWLGLLIVLYVAVDMMWRGVLEVACAYVPEAVCKQGLIPSMRVLLGS